MSHRSGGWKAKLGVPAQSGLVRTYFLVTDYTLIVSSHSEKKVRKVF